MANESDKLLASNYDGIQEYDNDLPRWWLALYIITVIFGLGYTLYFGYGPGLSPVGNLAVELKAAEAEKQARLAVTQPKETSEEELLALVKNSSAIGKGQEVYTGKCVACHGPQGQGLVGPNLTDKFWLHGSKITDNLRTVEEGVLDKGMLAWKGVLTPEEIKSVVAYIYTLRGTSPANPKAPQGDPEA